MADEKQLIDIEGLSHFKSKLDNEYNEKFKSKNDSTDLKGAVRYDTAQVLTEEQKAQAKANLGITDGGSGGGTVEGAVRYDIEQILNDGQKAKARANIGTTDGTWANMPDKPFGSVGFSVNQDNISSASVFVSFDLGEMVFKWCKVAEPYEGTIRNFKIRFAGTEYEQVVGDSDDNPVIELSSGSSYCMFAFNMLEDNETINMENFGITSLIVPHKGLYLLDPSIDGGEVLYFRSPDFSLKKIDKEYLPDDINIELPEGIVTTDENGLIPSSVLPSYVDDIVEGYYGEDFNNFYGWSNGEDFSNVMPRESGKIYIDLLTSNTYRWSGTQYVRINPDEYTVATNADIDALFT